ncbi:ribonuclease D [Frankia sp. AiPs1]|uniref:ribonuclease D n=1 Tax=Frankia sp. AiPs1 TaxID=573493 RepID=UPI0020445477|nr:ribonuclease D [Frankia sp. AiPs1]MCM3924157.1 ribonuclease D [Frankia sp. AiPs1]
MVAAENTGLSSAHPTLFAVSGYSMRPGVEYDSTSDTSEELSVLSHSPLIAHGDLEPDLIAFLGSQSRIAWDVETSGLDWRVDKLATCQIFAEGATPVVVQLDGRRRPENLCTLLADRTVMKVFHHAPFDLRFMVHAWNVSPRSVLCTKVASKLLSPAAPNSAHSLQSLLAGYLEVRLTKGAVRTSDWSAAELTADQIAYAVNDVVHLPRLLDALLEGLRNADLDDLYRRCCEFLPARVGLELGGFPDVFSY